MLDEDDLLQEVKQENEKLIELCVRGTPFCYIPQRTPTPPVGIVSTHACRRHRLVPRA